MSDVQIYTITLDDVQAYLDSKGDDEVIGVTCDGSRCILANALRMKYPDAQIIVVAAECTVVDEHSIDLSEKFIDLYYSFDALHGDVYNRPVAKREWLASQEVRL